MKKVAFPLLFLLLLGACFAPPVRGGIPAETASDYFPPGVLSRADGVPLDTHSYLHVVITAPPTAHYDISTFGPSRRSVSIKLTNGSNHPVDVRGLDAQFSATRNGVRFPCPVHHRTGPREREPSLLPPGDSYTFDRDLDCTMPLPGRYDVSVYITFNEPSAEVVADFADHFTFDVLQGLHAPRPYASRSDLFVAMVGDTVTRPLPPESWARGDYHVVLGIINGSAKPISLGPVRLSFLTYKGFSSLPCAGYAESVSFPAQIPSGSILMATAPVACAPSEEGIYEIVGRVALTGGPEVEAGRIDLTVTRDPLFFTPGGPRIWELSQ